MKLKNWLIGCGIGCGALAVIAVSSCVGLAVWVTRPGELIQPEQLLTPTTTGYVEWTLRLEDPGTESFVVGALELMQRVQQQSSEELPGWLTALQSRQDQRRAKQLRGLFPLLAVWTLQPGAQSGEDLHVLSLSLKQLGNRMRFADWALGFAIGRDRNARIHEHAGEKIYRLPLRADNWATFFIRGNDVFFCSDLDSATLVVDRLRDPATGSAGGGLARLVADAPTDQPLRGAIINDGGEFDRLFGPLPDQGWDAVRGLMLAGGLQADDSFRVRIEFLGTDADWARTQADAITGFVRERVHEYVEAEVRGRAGGERVLIDVVVTDIVGSMGEQIHSM